MITIMGKKTEIIFRIKIMLIIDLTKRTVVHLKIKKIILITTTIKLRNIKYSKIKQLSIKV